MTVERFAQEFTDTDSGEVERITTEPLEYWTEVGWEIIPAGFQFNGLPFFRLDPDESRLCLLYEWHRIAKRTPRALAVRLLWRELIKYTRSKQNGNTGRFWAKLQGLARIAAICLLAAVKM